MKIYLWYTEWTNKQGQILETYASDLHWSKEDELLKDVMSYYKVFENATPLKCEKGDNVIAYSWEYNSCGARHFKIRVVCVKKTIE